MARRIYIRPKAIAIAKQLPKVRRGGDYKLEMQSNRMIKKLLLYRRSVLLSYLSSMLLHETYQAIQYHAKSELIDFILARGLDYDLLNQFKVY